jgi:hypothetical protein
MTRADLDVFDRELAWLIELTSKYGIDPARVREVYSEVMRKIIVKRTTVDGHGRTCCERDETVAIDVRGLPSGIRELSVELTVFDRERQRYLPGKAIYVTLTSGQARQLAVWLTVPEALLRYDATKRLNTGSPEDNAISTSPPWLMVGARQVLAVPRCRRTFLRLCLAGVRVPPTGPVPPVGRSIEALTLLLLAALHCWNALGRTLTTHNFSPFAQSTRGD